MKKSLYLSWKILYFAYKANGRLMFTIILGTIYHNTIYPFVQILALAHILDIIQKKQQLVFLDFLSIGFLYLVATLINAVLSSQINQKRYLFDAQFESYQISIILKKLTTLDPATYESPHFQELLSLVNNIRGTMAAQIDRILNFLNAVTRIIVGLVILLPIFPWFIPLIILSVIPPYYYMNVSRTKLWPFFSQKYPHVIRVTEYIKNLLSQENTSKEAAIFKTGPALLQKVASEQSTFFKDFNKTNKPMVKKVTQANLIQASIFLVLQSITLKAIINRSITVGQFALVFQQSLNLLQGAQETLDTFSSVMMRMQLVEKFFDFLNYEQFITQPQSPQALNLNTKAPSIEFRNVSFKYPNTDHFVLKNFSLTIESGEKIAFVGENGVGKTTIIKLLLRFYDATDGEILIDGKNIKEIDLPEWHQHIGALFQDFIKYQFSFKENIVFGNLTDKDNTDQYNKAIDKSGASGFVEHLPKKDEQILGKMFENGIDLSGGQWQKVALARAFFRNAPVLILDEPTSAIDAKAEYEIFENVQHLQKDKTVIIISHRFSTVRNADRIIVLDQGKVIEEGSHTKLMKEKGLYEELFTIQAKGYK